MRENTAKTAAFASVRPGVNQLVNCWFAAGKNSRPVRAESYVREDISLDSR
jgi:hypothetical protein